MIERFWLSVNQMLFLGWKPMLNEGIFLCKNLLCFPRDSGKERFSQCCQLPK